MNKTVRKQVKEDRLLEITMPEEDMDTLVHQVPDKEGTHVVDSVRVEVKLIKYNVERRILP